MGIFHRLGGGKVAGKNASEERLFSVANALEPGTFDLSELEGLQSPGLMFFMQLPIPGDALETLDDMILSARTVAAALGGDVKDDAMSALTGQTIEHMKQRIADFALKQLAATSDGLMGQDSAPSQGDIERAAMLREQVAYHLHRYHVLDVPEIADAEFDALFDELVALEQAYPTLQTDTSPTPARWCSTLSQFEKYNIPSQCCRWTKQRREQS